MSSSHTENTFTFESPEPATGFKYRVLLSTQDIDVTPTFKELRLTYSDTDQPFPERTVMFL